jgi:OCT family organic cation transporter-like MFS transporter 3
MLLIYLKILLNFSILPESPRWLLMKKKNEKALKILQEVAKVNKKKLDEDLWSQFVESESVIYAIKLF